jgi:hypothetical protein
MRGQNAFKQMLPLLISSFLHDYLNSMRPTYLSRPNSFGPACPRVSFNERS